MEALKKETQDLLRGKETQGLLPIIEEIKKDKLELHERSGEKYSTQTESPKRESFYKNNGSSGTLFNDPSYLSVIIMVLVVALF